MRDEGLLSYAETTTLLSAYDIPLAPAQLVQTTDEAVIAARMLDFPVALKLISPAHTHKTEAGLVKLNLNDEERVREVANHLLEARDETREGLLVQKMIREGIEMIVGITHDAQFGPMIALGAGGVLVELLDDAQLRVPPLTLREANAMIHASCAARLLRGYRNRPPADIDALARMLVNVSRLAVERAHAIVELDLNPVLVLARGVVVVDARIVVRAASD